MSQIYFPYFFSCSSKKKKKVFMCNPTNDWIGFSLIAVQLDLNWNSKKKYKSSLWFKDQLWNLYILK